MSHQDLENFLAEGTLMIDFKHENVLSLIGVVQEDGERPLVVLPYMENGDLCSFIKMEDVVSDGYNSGRLYFHKIFMMFFGVLYLKVYDQLAASYGHKFNIG